MLNQSPELFNFGEVLGDWNVIRKLQTSLPFVPKTHEWLLDLVLGDSSFRKGSILLSSIRQRILGRSRSAKLLRQIRSFGVKDFSLNLQRFGVGDYLDRHPDIKVIGLQRTGIVERMLSVELLQATRIVSVKADHKASTRRINVDANRIVEKLSVIEREGAELDLMLGRLPPDRVRVCTYEELFGDKSRRDEIMTDLFNFLGVQPVVTELRMTKIVRAPIRDIVENYEECVRSARGTRYEVLLRAAAEH